MRAFVRWKCSESLVAGNIACYTHRRLRNKEFTGAILALILKCLEDIYTLSQLRFMLA